MKNSSLRRQLLPAELPTSVILLCGNFAPEAIRADRPELSIETTMRIGATAVYADFLTLHDRQLTSVTVTGGLVVGGVSEAEATIRDAHNDYPSQFEGVTFYPEDRCNNTVTSAQNTKALCDANGIDQAVAITSKTHIDRAAPIFHDVFQLTALDFVAAESLLLQGNPEQQLMAQHYLRSLQYRKRQAAETLLRGLKRVDPNDTLVNTLTQFFRRSTLPPQT